MATFCAWVTQIILKMQVLSFFSGAMGLDQGLEHAGFNIACVCENDASCQATIRANRPDVPIIKNIFDVDADKVLEIAGLARGDVKMVAGGPPCQSFSSAGARKGMACTNGNAFEKFLDIAVDIAPPYILIENVRGLLSSSDGADMQYVLDRLRNAGYVVSFNLYNTANYGVPQSRERVIIIATSKTDAGKVPYVVPTHSNDTAHGLAPWVTFREAVAEIQQVGDCAVMPENRLRFLRKIPPGGCWRNLPVEEQKEAMKGAYDSAGGKTTFFRRISWDRPSPTLVTSPIQNSTLLAHPVEDRPLSVAEYAKLQTFPDDWKICGTLMAKYRQLGNAVPALFAQHVGTTIIRHAIGGSHVAVPPNFPFSRYHNTNDETWGHGRKKTRTE